MTGIDPRWQKGTQMAFEKDAVRRLDERTYLVKSQTKIGGDYVVIATKKGAWKCNCPDHVYRKAKCKHIWAVEYSLELRREVEANVTVIPAINPKECIHCGSTSIVKDGIRHNKRVGDI
ncbi:MAG: SWIM zinc finger family protein, partial [Nitrososphaeraceae archaeon]